MNIQLADDMLKALDHIETEMFTFDANLKIVGTDANSIIASKQVVLTMLKSISVLRDDVKAYRNGVKAVANPQELFNKFIQNNMPKQGDNPPGFPPGFEGLQ